MLPVTDNICVDVGEREGSCSGAIYQLSTPSKNPVCQRIGFVRCIYNALSNNNYIVDRKQKKKNNDILCYMLCFAILTFWRHFILAGTSRHAACTSRKIHTMTYCILILTRNRRLATINYLLWCEYSPVMCP